MPSSCQKRILKINGQCSLQNDSGNCKNIASEQNQENWKRDCQKNRWLIDRLLWASLLDGTVTNELQREYNYGCNNRTKWIHRSVVGLI